MLDEFAVILQEAYKSTEEVLGLDDKGWVALGGTSSINVMSDADRRGVVAKARVYAAQDPLGKQAIRLWTDYTFGIGMTWNCPDEAAGKLLQGIWSNPMNQGVLSPRGQRKSSDQLLIDGEVFLTVFLGSKGEVRVRRINPLEITEIITDPDDIEDVRYFKREWTDTQGQSHDAYYRSWQNKGNEGVTDPYGRNVQAKDDGKGIVYHLAINTIGQRGNSLLLPALDWTKLYRQFLAARAAIMLAMARFAWKAKVQGGATAVAAVKAVVDQQLPAPGSVLTENMGVDMTPINANSQAQNAYQDARMLKLQICAAVGIPETYFGNLDVGNLATAKSVELPLVKQFQSYQEVWRGCYQEIIELILDHNGVAPDKRYVDIDFPAIAPEDAAEMAKNIQAILTVFPEFVFSQDVKQQALLSIGVHDIEKVLGELEKQQESDPVAWARVARELRNLREVISGNGRYR